MYLCLIRWLLGGLLLVVGAAGLSAQATPTALARASLSSTQLQIGDQFTLSVSISAPSGSEIGFIDFPAAFEENPSEIIQQKPLAIITEQPELLAMQELTLQLFDTGYVFMPILSIPLRYPDGRLDTLRTESLLLTVVGIPVEEDNALMPIKPILKEPLYWTDFWPLYVLLIGLPLVGLGIRAWRNGSRVKEAAVPASLAPHLLALQQLAALEEEQLWQKGQLTSYYTKLSYILRTYLEARFDLPAMESTTRQITTILGAQKVVDGDQLQELAALLQLSDLVKFAKAEPDTTIHAKGLARVRQFVHLHADNTPLSAPQNEEE